MRNLCAEPDPPDGHHVNEPKLSDDGQIELQASLRASNLHVANWSCASGIAEASACREARGPTDDPLSLSRCSACGCRPMGVEVERYASKSHDVTTLGQRRFILKIRGSSSADKTCGAVSFSIAYSSATGAIDDDCVQLRRQRRR